MDAVVCTPLLLSGAHLCQREVMRHKKAKLLFQSPRKVYGQFIYFKDSLSPGSNRTGCCSCPLDKYTCSAVTLTTRCWLCNRVGEKAYGGTLGSDCLSGVSLE